MCNTTCKFKVGDRVIFKKNCGLTLKAGMRGIVETGVSPTEVVVRLDNGYKAGFINTDSFLDKAPYPNPPHKHAEIIKAWADGADIEFYNLDDNWRKVTRASINPFTHPDRSYRVKPEKSEKELQIEKLEQQARDLADQIAKLKGN